jgi:precorrin-6A synthase
MRRVLVIGIGAGNPDYMTMQAVKALNEVDVFFILDKGQQKSDLVDLRKTICDRYIKDHSYRIVEVQSPERDAATGYKAGVDAWHQQKASILGRLIADELDEGECGAFLIWGDPALYDSTLRVIRNILDSGAVTFDYDVIPGITSVQALAAQHRITLNEIGEPVQITTGRKISEGLTEDAASAVVMLDNGAGLASLAGKDGYIYWGAYLGTPDEVLISGKISECLSDIERIRKEERERKGWIMDTYLVRRQPRS